MYAGREITYGQGWDWQGKLDLLAVSTVHAWEGSFVGFDFLDLVFAVAVVADLEDRGDGGVCYGWGGHFVFGTITQMIQFLSVVLRLEALL